MLLEVNSRMQHGSSCIAFIFHVFRQWVLEWKIIGHLLTAWEIIILIEEKVEAQEETFIAFATGFWVICGIF